MFVTLIRLYAYFLKNIFTLISIGKTPYSVQYLESHLVYLLHILLMRAWISSDRQTVMFCPIFMGCGYLPSLTPAHHDDFEIGSMGRIGGMDLLSPIICFSLKS